MDISTVEMPQTAVKEKKQAKDYQEQNKNLTDQELMVLLENSENSIYHLLFCQTESGDVKK